MAIPFSNCGVSTKKMLARVLTELTFSGVGPLGIAGDRLAAGDSPHPRAASRRSDKWRMKLSSCQEVVESVAEQMTTHDANLRGMATSMQEPDSSEGGAGREAFLIQGSSQ